MEKKRSGFLQSIVDIPLALKGFPKNLFKKLPKNKKELELYLRELSAYMWLGLVLIILGVVLGIDGIGMFVGMIGFAFIIFVFWKKNNVKNGGLGDQILDLSCPQCGEMITYDANVKYEVINSSWSVSATKTPMKHGEEAATCNMNISAHGTESTKVEIFCKCQKCGQEHAFTKSFETGYCSKSLRDVSRSSADKIRAQFENEVRQVCRDVFDNGSDGDNDFGVSVRTHDIEDLVTDYFNV